MTDMFGLSNLGAPKLKNLKFKRAGDRTLKTSDKEKIKRETGMKCQNCGKRFTSNLLEVHHKREVYKSKRRAGIMGQLGVPTFDRKKAYHDRKANLMVLCPTCHKKLHNKKSTDKKANKKKKTSNPWGFRI